jgi:hypothetical protein
LLCDLLYRGSDFYVYNASLLITVHSTASRVESSELIRRDAKFAAYPKLMESKLKLGLRACGFQVRLVLEIGSEVLAPHDSVSFGNFAWYLLSIPQDATLRVVVEDMKLNTTGSLAAGELSVFRFLRGHCISAHLAVGLLAWQRKI